MAQRQYLRKIRTGSARFEDVYRAVSEYRTQYPGKAVIYSAQKYPEMCWASFIAGGSCAAIPVTDLGFLYEVTLMSPCLADGICTLRGDNGYVIYNEDIHSVSLNLGKDKYIMYEINAKTGDICRLRDVTGLVEINDKGVFWLSKK